MGARFSKSQTDKVIAGVCGGIAESLDWDSTLVRALFVMLTIMGWGTPILLYLILGYSGFFER